MFRPTRKESGGLSFPVRAGPIHRKALHPMKLRTILGAILASTCVAATVFSAPIASAAPVWADASTAPIHPGAMTFTAGAQCTSNFVFYDAVDVYIGQAAHCSGTGAATETDGCLAESLPIGTPVEVDGASRPGTMVYNSWLTMQKVNETDPDACAFNDFALIRLDPADRGSVNPSIPVWGGPVGVGDETDTLETVYSYGNSSLRLGLTQLSPKTGLSLGTMGNGWSHPIYTVTPGIPGDSGSAVLDSDGKAVGVLSTLAVAPLPASNNATDIGKAIAYMESHGGPDVTLATGTSPFNGSPTGLLGGLLG